jgi:hypothetical protein
MTLVTGAGSGVVAFDNAVKKIVDMLNEVDESVSRQSSFSVDDDSSKGDVVSYSLFL